eukprot:CAMPEP_0196579924 /NCGR_PEP_ID=MMETSP1081-20130531/25758_1 /TAXON_ID=36882 /ORGANISM="Pyramimonas amylifera, Strain CCMP720" /LENGTH=213 /DNA_ID=CAMNT_0041899649 /DNA_START=247 /DNA_END=888 /DNA_ORIENTATION=-
MIESCSYESDDEIQERCYEDNVSRLLRAALRARGESRKCTRDFFQNFQLQKLNPNSRNKVGATALHAAAYHGKCSEARFLLTWLLATNVDARDKNGMTPLHVAVWRGHLDLLTVILRAGADTGVICKFKASPHSICPERSVEFTPLDFALLKGNKLMVNLLLEAKSRNSGSGMIRSPSNSDISKHGGLFEPDTKWKIALIKNEMHEFSRALRF